MSRSQLRLLVISLVAVMVIVMAGLAMGWLSMELALLILIGALVVTIAVRYVLRHESDGPLDGQTAYTPVVGEYEMPRLPVTPLSVSKAVQPAPLRAKEPSIAPPLGRPSGTSVATAPARTKEPSLAQAPRTKEGSSPGLVITRTRPPTDPSLDLPARPRTTSVNPVDVAHRLGGAPLEVAMRPPLPEPAHLPEDQIAVAPESGLTIRKRTPSAGPIATESLPLPPDIGMVIRTKAPSVAPMPMSSIAAALAGGPPVKLRGRVSYALTSAAFSGAGITANREDGLAKLVKWTDVVGIVARRLPAVAPYDGATFVDIVSTAGSTLRILPWTEITGHPLAGEPVERARSLVQLLVAQSPAASLDNATRTFANGSAPPAQLPDEKTLAAHDKRLA